MQQLTHSQVKHLRGLAHGLKPVVFIGQKGITPAVLDSMNEALDAHELIKVKFLDFKDRRLKASCAAEIEHASSSRLVGMIGHVALYYRPHHDPGRRKIVLSPGTSSSVN
jgi:RNA-binding protein